MFDLHIDKPQPSTNLQIANPQTFNAPSLSELRAKIPELSLATVLYSVRLNPLDEMVLNLEKLATTLAVSLGKKVTLRIDIPAIEVSNNLLRILREVLPQLIRNSVVHGIEDKDTREQLNKPEIGKIYFAIRKRPNNVTEVSLQDDGAGITVEAIRARLHALNINTSQMNHSQILQYIFKAQFSTASNITEHAGRGIGLALVKQVLEQAGASLKVHTRAGESTQFLMHFGANV
jgi:chemotaxis protein histidine kinase CheA